uniref:Sorbosone dehydrogenase n=2 Tax=Paracidobacterium acidisoli TaxID=2303751 RepID=A0A372IT86_9BACT
MRPILGLFALLTAFSLTTLSAFAAAPACDSGNGGITLPSGFCALVVADNLGAARHAVVAPNGDLFVGLQDGGIAALHDSKGNGRFDVKETFGKKSVTGIAFHDGYLYFATPLTVERYKWSAGQLKPTGAPEIVVSGFPTEHEHEDKGLTFDRSGHLYVNVGAPSNACQSRDRRAGVPGMNPCPILEKHGGVWRFEADKLNQTQQDGVRFATGLRQFPAITWHDGAVFLVMNNRDQLDTLWPKYFTVEDNATRPAEPMYRAVMGSNFGWPYCFYDYTQQKVLQNPEYGGDGKTSDHCSQYTLPVASYPAHWAPVDVMFYSGDQFPKSYRGGAFIAFHGSWNRAPQPQAGYNVTFQPFADGKPSGKFEVFADGFKGKDPLMNPSDAVARPDGLAQAPDGSLYITDSQHGKIWRVIYRGN